MRLERLCDCALCPEVKVPISKSSHGLRSGPLMTNAIYHLGDCKGVYHWTLSSDRTQCNHCHAHVFNIRSIGFVLPMIQLHPAKHRRILVSAKSILAALRLLNSLLCLRTMPLYMCAKLNIVYIFIPAHYFISTLWAGGSGGCRWAASASSTAASTFSV